MAISVTQACGHAFMAAWMPDKLRIDSRWGTLRALMAQSQSYQTGRLEPNQTQVRYPMPNIICEEGIQGGDLCDLENTELSDAYDAILSIDKSKRISTRELVIRKSELECKTITAEAYMTKLYDTLQAMYIGAVNKLDGYVLEQLYAASSAILPNGYSATVNPYVSSALLVGQQLNPQAWQQVDMAFKSVRMGSNERKVVGGLGIDNYISLAGGNIRNGNELWFDDQNNEAYANVFGANPANGEGAVMWLRDAVRMFYWSENLAMAMGGTIGSLQADASGIANMAGVLRLVDAAFAAGTQTVQRATIQDAMGIIWDVVIAARLQCIDSAVGEELVVTVKFITYPLINFPFGFGASCTLPANPVYRLNVCLPAAPEACDVPIPTPSTNYVCLERTSVDGCLLGNNGVTLSVEIENLDTYTGTLFGEWNLGLNLGIVAAINAVLSQNNVNGYVTLVSGVFRFFVPDGETFEIGDKITITTSCGGEVALAGVLCPEQPDEEEGGGGQGNLMGAMAGEEERSIEAPVKRRGRTPKVETPETPEQ